MPAQKSHSDAMAAELREIMSHAQALVEATAGEADEKISAVRKNLEKRLKSVKDKYGEVEDGLLETIKAADDLVREKPYYAVAGSFLGGLLLGLLVARK